MMGCILGYWNYSFHHVSHPPGLVRYGQLSHNGLAAAGCCSRRDWDIRKGEEINCSGGSFRYRKPLFNRYMHSVFYLKMVGK